MARPKAKQKGGSQLDMREFKPQQPSGQVADPDRYRNQRPMNFVRSEYQSGYYYQPTDDTLSTNSEESTLMKPLQDTFARMPALNNTLQKFGPHIADGAFHAMQLIPQLIVYAYILNIGGLHMTYSFLIAATIASSLTIVATAMSTNAFYVTYQIPLTLYCIVLLRGELHYRLNDILLFTTVSSLLLATILFSGSIKWWHTHLPRSFRAGVSIGSNMYLILFALTLIVRYTSGSHTSAAGVPNDPNYLGQLSQSNAKIDFRAQVSSVAIFVIAVFCYLLSFILNYYHLEETVEIRDSMSALVGPYQVSEGENQHLYTDPVPDELPRQDQDRTISKRAIYFLRQYQIAPLIVAFCALFYITLVGLFWPLKNSGLGSLFQHRNKTETVSRFYFNYFSSLGDFFNVFTVFHGSLGERWGTFVGIIFNVCLVLMLALFQIIDFINVSELLAHYKHMNRDFIASIHFKNAFGERRHDHLYHHHATPSSIVFHPHLGDCPFGLGCRREASNCNPLIQETRSPFATAPFAAVNEEKKKFKREKEKEREKKKSKKGKKQGGKHANNHDSEPTQLPQATVAASGQFAGVNDDIKGPFVTSPQEDDFKDEMLTFPTNKSQSILDIAGSPVSAALMSPLGASSIGQQGSLSPTHLYNTDHDAPVPEHASNQVNANEITSSAISGTAAMSQQALVKEPFSEEIPSPAQSNSREYPSGNLSRKPLLQSVKPLLQSVTDSQDVWASMNVDEYPSNPTQSNSIVSPSGVVSPVNNNSLTSLPEPEPQYEAKPFELPRPPCLCDDPLYNSPDEFGPFPFTSNDQAAAGFVTMALVLTSFFSFFGLTVRPYPLHMLTSSTAVSAIPSPKLRADEIYHGIDINELNQAAKNTTQVSAVIVMLLTFGFASNISELFMVPVIVAFFLFTIGFDAVRVSLHQYWHFEQHANFYSQYYHHIDQIKAADGNLNAAPPRPTDVPLSPIQEGHAKDRPPHVTINIDRSYPAHFFFSILLFSITLLLCSLGLISQAIAAGTIFILCQFVTNFGQSVGAWIQNRLKDEPQYEPLPSIEEESFEMQPLGNFANDVSQPSNGKKIKG